MAPRAIQRPPNPARIMRAGGTALIKKHGGVRSWVLNYKLGLAKMPNHECYQNACNRNMPNTPPPPHDLT